MTAPPPATFPPLSFSTSHPSLIAPSGRHATILLTHLCVLQPLGELLLLFNCSWGLLSKGVGVCAGMLSEACGMLLLLLGLLKHGEQPANPPKIEGLQEALFKPCKL